MHIFFKSVLAIYFEHNRNRNRKGTQLVLQIINAVGLNQGLSLSINKIEIVLKSDLLIAQCYSRKNAESISNQLLFVFNQIQSDGKRLLLLDGVFVVL